MDGERDRTKKNREEDIRSREPCSPCFAKHDSFPFNQSGPTKTKHTGLGLLQDLGKMRASNQRVTRVSGPRQAPINSRGASASSQTEAFSGVGTYPFRCQDTTLPWRKPPREEGGGNPGRTGAPAL